MKTLFKHTPKRSNVPCLKDINVIGGQARVTDMDFILSYPTDTANGLYTLAAAKAGAWVASGNDNDKYPMSDFALSSDAHKVTVNVSDLAWLSSAMSSEEVRYYLGGINFDDKGITATDGHSLKHIAIATGIEGKSKIVPSKAIEIILDAAKESKVSTVDITFYNYNMTCRIGAYYLQSKLIDGIYPQYERVIPADSANMTSFNSMQFKSALPLAKALGGKSCPVIIEAASVSIKGNDDKSWDIGGAFDIRIGFNCQYLVNTDISGMCHYDTPTSPIKVVSGNRIAVIMPIRV